MKINHIKTNNKTLSEALSTPYPYKWTKASPHWYEAEYNQMTISFILVGLNRNNWEIMFEVDGFENMTGGGDAFKILSTVVAATKEWWTRQDPTNVKTIQFSAEKDTGDGDGRQALYQRFAAQFAKSIGFNLRTDASSKYMKSDIKKFHLTNPNYREVKEDGRVVKGVNTTADVKPGETRRQAAKFGNKVNSKNEPPLLNAKVRKNSSPHVLSNLGLTESVKLTELFNKTHTWNWASKSPTMWKASFESADGGDMEVYLQSDKQSSVHYDVAFKKAGTIKRTGDGDQFTILATVMDIIDAFLKENASAESIGFSAKREGAAADDPKIRDSRASLYKKMLTKVAKANNFEIAWEEVARMTDFILRRNTTEVTEAITSLENPKSEKFGIDFDEYTPEGKQIGKVGRYQLWFTPTHPAMRAPAAQIWDPKAKKMAGVIRLKQDRRMKLSAKTYITGTAVVNDAYAGKGVVYKGYAALLKLGYNLISDDYQSGGGKKIWAKLANTTGIHVYAVIPGEAGKRTKYSAVDADDLTAANFQVYKPTEEDNEYELRLDQRYEDLMQQLTKLGADEIADHKDKIAMVKKELDATIQDRVASEKKDGKRNNARLMATAETLSESIKKPRPEDTLGVSRADMPQVHASHYPELFNYLKANGATISKSSVQASALKAVQGEFSDEGVEKMMRKTDKDGGTSRKKPLIVSSDNYIIDGHHRWLAAYNMDEQVPIIKFSLPVKELLQLVKDFKHTTYRGIYKEAKSKKPKYSVIEQACIDGGHDLADIEEVKNEKKTKRRRSNNK